MAVIPKMNVATFVATDYANFHHICAFAEVMLSKVHANNEIINIYRQIPKFGERSNLASLQIVLDIGDSQRRVGVKRKVEVVEEVVPAKLKRQRKLKKKAKIFVVDWESDEKTISDTYFTDTAQHEQDTARSSEQPTITEKLETSTIPTKTISLDTSQIPKVSSIPTTITTPLPPPTETDISIMFFNN